MAMKETFTSPYRRRKAERDYRIREDWLRYTAMPGASRIVVAQRLAEKYQVCVSTIYSVIRRGGRKERRAGL